jgi:hypothetical protein
MKDDFAGVDPYLMEFYLHYGIAAPSDLTSAAAECSEQRPEDATQTSEQDSPKSAGDGAPFNSGIEEKR